MKSAFQRTTNTEIELKDVRQVVVVGDVGCTGFDDQSKQVFGAVLRHQADLFIINGDIAQTGATEQFVAVMEFCNTRAQAPVFALCGNHDLPGYAECCGLFTYAIVLERAVLVCLDNSRGSFETADLEFLRHQLQKHDRKRFVVLFHVPPPLEHVRSVMKEDAWHELRMVLDSYKNRIECIICGHIHGFYEYDLDGYHIFITAGGGAAMIHELPREQCKIFNALRLVFKDDASIAIEMVPVQV
ncbi:MAG: metallophosphoesterase [Verrucomicrobia bacterium]|nr:metallophosphoesterase [Verrucomicrobiota bacterium]